MVVAVVDGAASTVDLILAHGKDARTVSSAMRHALLANKQNPDQQDQQNKQRTASSTGRNNSRAG